MVFNQNVYLHSFSILTFIILVFLVVCFIILIVKTRFTVLTMHWFSGNTNTSSLRLTLQCIFSIINNLLFFGFIFDSSSSYSQSFFKYTFLLWNAFFWTKGCIVLLEYWTGLYHASYKLTHLLYSNSFQFSFIFIFLLLFSISNNTTTTTTSKRELFLALEYEGGSASMSIFSKFSKKNVKRLRAFLDNNNIEYTYEKLNNYYYFNISAHSKEEFSLVYDYAFKNII